jgi:hypothetical protein
MVCSVAQLLLHRESPKIDSCLLIISILIVTKE